MLLILASACSQMELDLEDWPCQSRDDCVNGYACNLATGRCQQVGSLCEDYDGDKIGNGAGGNPGCAHQAVDIDDTDPSVCGDTDLDGCEDCASLTFDPTADGPDTDEDGLCDDGDPDDDGDGVIDEEDAYPFDSTRCRDVDEDACDDCSSGSDDPSNDGDDNDGDGTCNTGDDDDDGDTVLDDDDLDPLDNSVCRDLDSDDCDDCAVTHGPPDTADDGLDTDLDGTCNLGDADDDDDTVDDGDDLAPLDPYACRDQDADGCDDCSQSGGPPDTADDGLDTDLDGACNVGDADDDGDTVDDGDDLAPLDPRACRDQDADTCDDCSSGTDAPGNDGTDTDHDGICDAGDTCTDEDTDGLGNGNLGNTTCVNATVDSADNNPNVCADTDGDTCDDCDGGSFDPAGDGADLDGDGLCDSGDPDIDGDGVGNAGDPNDFDRFVCGDSDSDTCDDCEGGSFDPANDGDDLDGDGLCDSGDPDIDGDGVANASDPDDFDSSVCGDSDADACDDCSVTAGPPDTNNDGSDQDSDGVCDATDACTDEDTDGLGNGNLGNAACVNATVDSADNNPNVCADTDGDTCDDCDGGSFDPADDGDDLDGDGLCDSGDPDIDGDGVGNAGDPNDFDRFECGDSDSDACDDCSQTGGPPDVADDGTDTDNDGVCDATDACTDQDTDGLGNGNLGNAACINATADSNDNNSNVCADTDGDACDDCDGGSFDPANDGDDLDGDGLCNDGDPDIDGDGVGNAGDPNDFDRFVCGDSDADTCDDCSQTGGPPNTNNDGSDRDSDGTCDAFDWYDADWQWRIPISVNQALVVGTLTDFPVLVSISGATHMRDNALADPDDLVFTEGDGKTRTSAEVEEWVKANGDLLAWVRLPTISNTGGTSPELYLYYGYSGAAPLPVPPAASGVWDTSFRAVWHLDDDPSTGLPAAIEDSTLYGNHGAAVGATGEWVVDDLVDAVIGQGTRFDHASTYLNMGSDSSIDDLDPLTFEVWIHAYSWGGGTPPGYGRIVTKANSFGTHPFSFYCYGASSELITYRDRDTTNLEVRTDGDVVALNAWFHVALVVETSTDALRFYVNGVEADHYSDEVLGAGAPSPDSTYNLLLGNNGNQDRNFDGVLDEARLSSAVRSAAWIRTSYNTQVNPSSFLSFGSEQERPAY